VAHFNLLIAAGARTWAAFTALASTGPFLGWRVVVLGQNIVEQLGQPGGAVRAEGAEQQTDSRMRKQRGRAPAQAMRL